jgi:hypothetical protein
MGMGNNPAFTLCSHRLGCRCHSCSSQSKFNAARVESQHVADTRCGALRGTGQHHATRMGRPDFTGYAGYNGMGIAKPQPLRVAKP